MNIASDVSDDSASVARALAKAVASQFHPKMLALLMGPFLLSIVVWAGAVWLLWGPLTGWIGDTLFSSGWLKTVNQWILEAGLPAPKSWVPALIALLLIVPLMFATAVTAIAAFAMPLVIRHLAARDYADIERKGSLSVSASLWNSLSSLAVFAVGYIVTLPLWFIPPLFIVIPLLWWAWLNSRVLRFDSLQEHASDAELKTLVTLHKGKFRLLGLATASLNYVPPLFIVAPVFGALAFAHFSFQAIRDLRVRASSQREANQTRQLH